MTYLNLVIILSASLYQPSGEISFFLQKATYSDNLLIKTGTPNLEISSRSPIECFKFCQILLQNDCKSFKFDKQRKFCSIYKDVIRYDSNEFINGSLVGYQTLPDCPSGFRYLIEVNKCVQMKVGTWNWSEARTQCNNLHPLSHPIILDCKLDAEMAYHYFQNEILPKCVIPIFPATYNYWTAGISPYINGMRQPFQWNPFPGSVRQLKPTTPWGLGEPNSYADGNVFCIHQSHVRDLDDYSCDAKICVLCEIDMP